MGLRSIVRVRYELETGGTCVIKQQQQIQEAAGNVLADGSEGVKPDGLKPRHIQASWFSAGGVNQAVGKFTRSVVIGSAANPLYTGADREITLADMESAPGVGQNTPNVMRAFRTTGRVGESLTF